MIPSLNASYEGKVTICYCFRYSVHLNDAKGSGIKKGITVGFSMGLIYFIVFSVYGFGFWYGAKIVREDSDYDPGNVLIVRLTLNLFCLFHSSSNHRKLICYMDI